ncbi:MAG: AIR synthase-related protein [Planctomycetota bacterium]
MSAPTRTVRIEVWPQPGQPDPLARQAEAHLPGELSGAQLRSAAVYLVTAPLEEGDDQGLADRLLVDPASELAWLGARPGRHGFTPAHAATAEVWPLPGVMDPAAASAELAVRQVLRVDGAAEVAVRTGRRFDAAPGKERPHEGFAERFHQWAGRGLGNPVVESVQDTCEPARPHPAPPGYAFEVVSVPLGSLDDAGLAEVSRNGAMALNTEEMRAIQAHFNGLGRDPTDVELESLAQTWSEHCVHKTLKSTVRYRAAAGAPESALDIFQSFAGRDGFEPLADGVVIDNLLKRTVAAATFDLRAQDPAIDDWLVSVFDDNSGIVRFDEHDGVCIKVETHNHPSAIEPYGGAATGAGGCLRDILGTGLAARPIAATDVFCVGMPHQTPPTGALSPKYVLERVVAGVRDYGNRMGVPTVNGAVHFHPDYVGNPLVYCGAVGLIPLDKCFGDPEPGDRIIALGGATGRDGIHGATFSSESLTDQHADAFGHAVQIGNPITERKLMDVILQARDWPGGPLFRAITDCGAGGFSSAVGEMGEKVGAQVDLDQAPLKYAGLSYAEVWISEAQERMVLAVPPGEQIEALRTLCASEDLGFADLGTFGSADAGTPELVLRYQGNEVGRLAMGFLHDGLPKPTRDAIWPGPAAAPARPPRAALEKPLETENLGGALLRLLGDPNIASKRWVVRQYDHEVQGGSAVKPLVGPAAEGPGDASVLRPKPGSYKGVVLGCGLAPHLSEKATAEGLADNGDSYWATLAAMDEAARNAVCVGADPGRLAILDNFCWPRCTDPAQLGSLTRAAVACYDGAMAYRAPFVSGKDSLSNQFETEDGRTITIPPTMLITAMGVIDDVRNCVTMDLKRPGAALLLVGGSTGAMGGSFYRRLMDPNAGSGAIPELDLKLGPAAARWVAGRIAEGRVLSAHDASEGGWLVAAAEMAIGGALGLALDVDPGRLAPAVFAFGEAPGRYLLEVAAQDEAALLESARSSGLACKRLGRVSAEPDLVWPAQGVDVPVDDLHHAWIEPLDW